MGNEPNHPERTYLLDLSGNEKPITPEGIVALAATSDGKRILTFDVKLSQFQLFPLDGGQPQTLSIFQSGDRPVDFTPGDAAVLVRRQSRDAVEIWRVELASGKRTLLHTVTPPGIPSIANGLSATVSRDGKSYASQYHPSVSTEYLVTGLH